jgi:predicted transcriptional regulator
MKTLKLEIDDETFERARQLAEKRHTTLEYLVGSYIRHLTEPAVAEDRVLGSMRDEPELVDEMMAEIMKERERGWSR